MSKQDCNTCGKKRPFDKSKVRRVPRKVDEYVVNNCKDCRRKRYNGEQVVFSWHGYPGGSEGNMLHLLLRTIGHKGYTEDDIDYVIINKQYKWDKEAFNFAYFDDCGCHELTIIKMIVMKDG